MTGRDAEPTLNPGEVFVGRGIPERKTGDEAVEVGWVWDELSGLLVGLEGHNPHPDDTFEIELGVGGVRHRLVLPPGGKERVRLDLDVKQPLRRAVATDNAWQRAAGWVAAGVDSVTVRRVFGKPTRNSPVIDSVATTEFISGATTTHDVPMPATVAPGDGLVVLFFHDNNSLVQASGFSERAAATNTDRGYVFAKVATGTEDGTNVDFQALTASFALAHVYQIQAGTWAGVVDGVYATAATGSGTGPNPPDNAPRWGSDDNLWLVFASKASSGTLSGAPTNYTNFTTSATLTFAASARRSLTAASDDPGAFTGTTSVAWVAFTVAIASDDADFGDIPVFVGAGTTAAGTGGVSPGLPGGIVTGDKLLLHIQGEGEDANADPANADWSLVDTQASATGGAAGDTRLTVYEVDYDSSDPPSLSVGDAGDHAIALITAWRDPNGGTLDVHQVQGTTDSSGDTSLSATGVTTTENNCMIVVSVGLGDDSGVMAWTNASLASPPIQPAAGDRTTQGSDGSVMVGYGGLATAGASGTTTGTLATSEEEANIVIALVPVAGGTPATATPAAISATLAIPAGAAKGAAKTTPAVTVGALTVPAATVTGGGKVLPGVVSAGLSVPAVVVHGGSVTGPSVVAAALTVPSVTAFDSGAAGAAAPAVTETSAAIPAVTVSGAASVTPSTLTATLNLPAVSLTYGTVTTPAVLDLALALPEVSVVGSGAATVTPAQIAAALAVPQATPLSTGSVSLSVLSAVLAIPAATAAGPAKTAPSVLNASLSLYGPTPTAATSTAPSPVGLVLALPDVQVFGPAQGDGGLHLVVVLPAAVGLDATEAITYQEGGLTVTVLSSSLAAAAQAGGLTVSSQSSGLEVAQ